MEFNLNMAQDSFNLDCDFVQQSYSDFSYKYRYF